MGYHIRFNANDTINIYRVTSMAVCRYRLGNWRDIPNIYSIGTESSFTLNGRSSLNYPLPANGLIFAEDDIWVDELINTAASLWWRRANL